MNRFADNSIWWHHQMCPCTSFRHFCIQKALGIETMKFIVWTHVIRLTCILNTWFKRLSGEFGSFNILLNMANDEHGTCCSLLLIELVTYSTADMVQFDYVTTCISVRFAHFKRCPIDMKWHHSLQIAWHRAHRSSERMRKICVRNI